MNWKERFDERFYRNKDRIWMSKDGESYGSVAPEMGRAELLRFITQELSRQAEEIRGEVKKYKCAEHKKLLSLLDKYISNK